MKHLVRTFVGIRCGGPCQRRLHQAGVDLKGDDPALKVPAAQDLHLTLHYLGSTPPEDIADIAEALEEAAEQHAPFEIVYRGLGAFPDAARPRVAWVGIEDPDGGPPTALIALQRALGRALREVGYRPERRAFHPHVTVARVHRHPSERVLETLGGPLALGGAQPMDLGGEMLSEVKLILSDPGQRPYHYIDLTTVELG
ncbi:MAG: RNA 2',3'-cyclic phosphodiesterase [Planctomycetota bacterium]|nr:RNA 2',3'-cyclic phosphodiesterase [Planctomycetota bacterium]